MSIPENKNESDKIKETRILNKKAPTYKFSGTSCFRLSKKRYEQKPLPLRVALSPKKDILLILKNKSKISQNKFIYKTRYDTPANKVLN